MRLYHFSEDPGITWFEPRAVVANRPPGREWLNGPLVWAIDEWHSPMYLFPRECPRIVTWPVATTTPEDRERAWGSRTCRMIAHVEWRWLDRLRKAKLYRYVFDAATFEDLNDAGMWVSRQAVEPLKVEPIGPLLDALAAAEVELRVMDSLLPLRNEWESTLHVSGIRLRNAVGWERD